MNRFSYERSDSVEAALQAITGRPGGRFIGGGTDLLDLMKRSVVRADHLIDISHLNLARLHELEHGGLHIGALVRNADLAYAPQVQSRYPLLAQALLAGASPQLRNMATTGGNLMQRTRCGYFLDTGAACNKREPGSGCPAIEGHNRIHAILGASEHCVAVHPSDMCVAMAALEAVVRVTGPHGDRSIDFSDFHRLPGRDPARDNTLSRDELIVGIDLPAEGYAAHSAYLKLRDRASQAYALVSVAAALRIEHGVIAAARIALGGVAHKPWRDPDVEDLLVGQPPTPANFGVVADRLVTGAQPLTYNRFKVELARRAVVRALERAAAGAAP